MATSIVSLCLLALASCIAQSSPTLARSDRPTVTLDSGPITGAQTSVPGRSRQIVEKFLGIPFAAPPVRFSPPVPPEPWTEPIDALEPLPACYQQFSRNGETTQQWFNTPAPPESEDCLGLNVFAPAFTRGGWWKHWFWSGKGKKGKPVLFWIYGGGLQFGNNYNAAYDGSSFAANQDVVVVTTNYRTNVFGFPSIPDRPVGTNNLGFLDQRLALDWVQRNIAAFGGDPDSVTIFGQSAGALSVDALVTEPPQPVPFHAAIYQSGQASIRATNPTPYAAWQATVDATNCTDAPSPIDCVRAVPGEELLNLITELAITYTPIPDNVTYSSTAREDRLVSTPADSNIARVPVLIGTTAEEGKTYALGYNDTQAFLQTAYPRATEAQRAAILEAFAIGSTPSITDTFTQVAAILTHYQFQCTAGLVAGEIAQVEIPVWRYYFNASFANLQLFEGSGVYHASEIQIVFGTNNQTTSTPYELELNQFMQKTWADFARDPSGGPGWPMVPTVASLGNVRYDSGPETGESIELVDQAVVDERCAVIYPLYGS